MLAEALCSAHLHIAELKVARLGQTIFNDEGAVLLTVKLLLHLQPAPGTTPDATPDAATHTSKPSE